MGAWILVLLFLFGQFGYVNCQKEVCDYTDIDGACKDEKIFEVAGENSFIALPSSNQFLVSLQDSEKLPDNCYYHSCGGSFITPDLVVTAAHCIYDQIRGRDVGTILDPELFAAHAQACRHLKGYGRYKVIKYWIHKRYRRSSLENDIAVLQLNQSVDLATLVDYKVDVVQKDLSDAMLSVVGWGSTDTVDRRIAYNVVPLTAANNLKIIDSEDCATRMREVNEFNDIEPGMICALGNATDSCKGDSGGPLTYFKDGRTYLVGIVSWGSKFSQCSTNQPISIPSVYTDVAYYQQWIQDIVDEVTNTTASPLSPSPSPSPINPIQPPVAQQPIQTSQGLLSPSPQVQKDSSPVPTPSQADENTDNCVNSVNGCSCLTDCFYDQFTDSWCEVDPRNCDASQEVYYYDYEFDWCEPGCGVAPPKTQGLDVQTTVNGCTCQEVCRNPTNDINGNWCEVDPTTCTKLLDWQKHPKTDFTWDYCIQEFRGDSKGSDCNNGCLCTPIIDDTNGTSSRQHYCQETVDQNIEPVLQLFNIDTTLPWCRVINREECGGKEFINCNKTC